MAIDSIGCVEFHDARIERLVISVGGKLEIDFGHVCLYEANEISDDMGNAWSARAKLLLGDTTRIEVVGTIGADDYVAVGHLMDQAGNSFAVVNAASTNLARSCEFQLAGSGASIRLSFGCW